jgi:hypothetical protein
MNDATLNMKLPHELMERVNLESAKKCISSASLVRMILAEHFERKENKK